MKSKKVIQFLLFIFLMLLTFYTIFSKNDMKDVVTYIYDLDPIYLVCAVFSALFFVAAEGFMIWYLLRAIGKNTGVLSCIGYSYIGFFFSGITPSASGGQPVQLYYMKKDGIPLAEGTLSLMTVAVLYKFILVLIGVGVLIFWKNGLALYLGSYMALYYLGIFLNALLVIILILIMLHGEWMGKIIEKAEKLCIRLHLCKPSAKRKEAIHHMIHDYQDTLQFLIRHKSKVVFVAIFTFIQRCSLFILTYFIYRGLHLSKESLLLIMVLQATVYIAVDMLPLPGSQGISELMYYVVFMKIFADGTLTASMCITRGINFYLLLVIGAIVTLYRFIRSKKCNNRQLNLYPEPTSK